MHYEYSMLLTDDTGTVQSTVDSIIYEERESTIAMHLAACKKAQWSIFWTFEIDNRYASIEL